MQGCPFDTRFSPGIKGCSWVGSLCGTWIGWGIPGEGNIGGIDGSNGGADGAEGGWPAGSLKLIAVQLRNWAALSVKTCAPEASVH
jgi:hypothetical protein